MAEIKRKTTRATVKPFLKWAGGKTQLLDELRRHVPAKYDTYIEPFIGGGAMFFDIQPQKSVIADSNPQLVNAYRCLRDDPEQIIALLEKFKNEEEFYYKIRQQKFQALDKFYAAARTIYLNKTCYNGLYRVNRRGEFNVPFGRYKNPRISNPDVLFAASEALQNTTIECADYKTVLKTHAKSGDLIFLDPPYLPVSEYADFQRYTKEQFYEEDHRDLADEVNRLKEVGCHIILTNSNHPLVHDLYEQFDIEVVNTRRNISSRTKTRAGEDVIVTAKAHPRMSIKAVPNPINERASSYLPTRYMGSKEKLLPYIQNVAENFEFDSAIDLFAGTGVVGYLFKTMGKRVFSNDYMAMSTTYAKAMIENSKWQLSEREIDQLFAANPNTSTFVQDTFQGLYYADKENEQIDLVRSNIRKIRNPHKRAIALSALIRACLKKRARGIFTYTGLRYDDGRADLQMSFEEQIRNAATIINQAVFDNGTDCRARCGDAMQSRQKADLAYIDPPYYSPLSDNEYVRRYHFVEGLVRDWEGVEIQEHTKTKKFKNYPTPFSSRTGAADAFDRLFYRLRESVIMVSYSSNSLPTKDEIIHLMSKHKRHVEVIDIDHRYSFANQASRKDDNRNEVKEYLFVGY